MLRNRHKSISPNICMQKNAGFTLTELLIALVLGLFMVTAVIQSYLMTKRTYKTTTQVSRIQENTRFATHFMNVALRESGNRGCVDEVRNMLTNLSIYDLSKPVIGWDFANTTSGDTYNLLANLDPGIGFSAADWTQSGAGAIVLPDVFDDLLVKGSDVFIVNKLKKQTQVLLSGPNPTGADSLNTETAHNIEDGQILLVTDCSPNSADLFQHKNGVNTVLDASSGGAAYDPGNKNLAANVWSSEWLVQSDVYSLESEAFFVGYNASNIPALYRYNLGKGFAIGAPEELVEGVENMQVVYGEDTDADNVANRFVSASEVNNWDDVVSVRISVLVRSLESATDDVQVGNTFVLGENITINPTDDYLLRYVVTNTIKLRNKGLINEINTCEANSDPVIEDDGTNPTGCNL